MIFYKEQFSCYFVHVCSLILLSKIVLLYSFLKMFFCTPVKKFSCLPLFSCQLKEFGFFADDFAQQ